MYEQTYRPRFGHDDEQKSCGSGVDDNSIKSGKIVIDLRNKTKQQCTNVFEVLSFYSHNLNPWEYVLECNNGFLLVFLWGARPLHL